MALSAVWLPTIDRNQSAWESGSRAKASAVAEKPPALIVNRSSGSRAPALSADRSCVASMVSLLVFGVG